MTDSASNPTRPLIWIVAAIWLIAAFVAGATGLVAAFPFPFPQFILIGLTLTMLNACLLLTPFRRWAATVSLRSLIAIHLTRFVGGYFLWLSSYGELPRTWAAPAGWGDLAVAATAALVIIYARTESAKNRRIFLTWNLLGFADIVFVVVNAARHGSADPDSMRALTQLPLSLLPTFLVPVIIATHVIIFVRLWQARGGQ